MKILILMLFLCTISHASSWEYIETNREAVHGMLFRMRVINGWLVMLSPVNSNNNIAFVPDPKHEWKIK